ncbi:MAG: endolytic transglycosylase MltG [Betaproteobacteria bacterium]|nr:endolytic transglycosylase MltG [Betaproteobacteria bacterium]
MLACAIAGAYLWYAPALAVPVALSIKPGTSARAVARELHEKGVIVAAEPLVWLMRIGGKDGQIKAGSYEFEAAATPLAVLDMLTAGDGTQIALTIVEGWTFEQMRAALAGEAQLRQTVAQLALPEALRRMGVAEAHPEGLFFPDTYHFAPGSPDTAVYRRAYRAMQERLLAGWQSRDPDLPYASPYEALIMASIVEKETGQGRDRAQIASVFVNRLRLGMRLQTDPTVIYGMGAGFDGNLKKRDLEADTPYNTYARAGLPPTPIALPGKASLEAALHPDRTRYLYFVARGDGSSHFSTNLDDHNRAVNKYQRGGR